MLILDNILIGDDITGARFACDLAQCKGACCIQGDTGAPLEPLEIAELEDHLDDIAPFMTRKGLEVVRKEGVFDYDQNGHFVTPLVNGRECAFAVFEKRIARCAIEKAYEAGRIPFGKPISCHLYPIRLSQTGNFTSMQYHRWHICQPARTCGKKKNIPLCLFLKDALIRRFGADWFERLDARLNKP
ncbi:MAG: DUF3109 family protein [Bacteroidales bacterium]|nr:DUF3109 family protein [Bacteroidales bacterium]